MIFGVVDFLRIMEALTRGRLNATDVLKDNRKLAVLDVQCKIPDH
jgi:hypothetical protein